MKTNWPKIWRDFQKAYDKHCCDWPGQKKMIRKIVDGYFEGNDINWKQLWKEFDRWCDTCPTCSQICNQGFHTEWDGKGGQEEELEWRLKQALKFYKVPKKKKVSA